MKVDRNKECGYCPITLCEKRSNYTDTGVTNKINKEHIQNSYSDVTAKFTRK